MLVVNQAVRKYAALESTVITKISGHNDTRDNIYYLCMVIPIQQ